MSTSLAQLRLAGRTASPLERRSPWSKVTMKPIRAKIYVWTCTTGGDNCPISTTVHADLAGALFRVRSDLAKSLHCAPEDFSDRNIEDCWKEKMGGVCIIERYVISGELAP
jgi:hypothetical protein